MWLHPKDRAERVAADHASILDAMRALNPESELPAAAVTTSAPAGGASQQQEEPSAGGVGGVQWR